MRSLPLRLLMFLLLLLALTLAGPAGRAEDEDGADPAAEDDEPLDDTADGPVPFGEQIDRAIDRGVTWLLARPALFEQRDTQFAHWGLVKGARIYGGGDGPQYRHPAGPTALALYTLLKCGVDPKHPVITKGFNWLREEHVITEEYDATNGVAIGWSWSHRDARGSYEVSAEILALCAKYDQYKRSKNTRTNRRRGKLRIRDKEDKEWLQDLVAALVERRGVPAEEDSDEVMRGWRYNLKELTLQRGSSRSTQRQPFGSTPGHGGNEDLSSTQLAALALFSAHQFGVKVPEDVWVDIALFTLDHQEAEGPEHQRHDPILTGDGYAAPMDHARGFVYLAGSTEGSEGTATGSMTGCGLANLLMAKDVLMESARGRKRWEKHDLETRVHTAIWDALAWLDRNWSPFRNPGSNVGYPIYYLYAIERAMDLRGKQLIGKHLWYNEGAKELLDRQKPVRVADALDERAPELPGVYWETGQTHEPEDVLDTCFALLFLKRAMKGMGPVTGGDGPPVDNR